MLKFISDKAQMSIKETYWISTVTMIDSFCNTVRDKLGAFLWYRGQDISLAHAIRSSRGFCP